MLISIIIIIVAAINVDGDNIVLRNENPQHICREEFLKFPNFILNV
jgi:hypothetical protein